MPLPQANFQSLKQRIPIDWVLARYGVKLRPAGPHTLYGACPLPTHTSRQSRESFSVNLSLRVWSCHSASCRAARDGRIGGHAIDLVAIMEHCGLRQAGLCLQDWFGVRATDPPVVRPAARTSAPADPNRPLGFTLQGCRWRRKRVPKWRPGGALSREPFGVSLSLLLGGVVQNGPEPSKARRCWARRSEPLTARTVLR
jgi:hypothetical protein